MKVSFLVHRVRHLFEHDDGSLPDIYIEGLQPAEIVSLYAFIRSRSQIYGEPSAWNIAREVDVPLFEMADPARSYIEGEIETFRHGLVDLEVGGVQIPDLTVSMEPDGVSFDYRMGTHWTDEAIGALLRFLAEILQTYPHARIRHAYESLYDRPNTEFEEVVNAVSRPVV